MDEKAFADAISAYCAKVDSLVGFFFDCRLGFLANVRDAQAMTARMRELGVEPTDQNAFVVGTDPRVPGALAFHRTTQGEHRSRNDHGGANHATAGALLIVSLFAYWERPRARIAEALGCPTNDVEIDALGDLRLLRNEILHGEPSISEATAARLKVLKFPAGTAIAPDHDKCVELALGIYRALGEYAEQRGVVVPGLGRVG